MKNLPEFLLGIFQSVDSWSHFRLCLFQHYIDKEETTGEVIEVDDKISERKMEFKEVLVVETNELSFWCQYAAQGQKLNALQAKLSQEMAANPPLAGSFTPKKGTY